MTRADTPFPTLPASDAHTHPLHVCLTTRRLSSCSAPTSSLQPRSSGSSGGGGGGDVEVEVGKGEEVGRESGRRESWGKVSIRQEGVTRVGRLGFGGSGDSDWLDAAVVLARD